MNGKSEARRAKLRIHVNGKRETYVAYAMRQTLAGISPHLQSSDLNSLLILKSHTMRQTLAGISPHLITDLPELSRKKKEL